MKKTQFSLNKYTNHSGTLIKKYKNIFGQYVFVLRENDSKVYVNVGKALFDFYNINDRITVGKIGRRLINIRPGEYFHKKRISSCKNCRNIELRKAWSSSDDYREFISYLKELVNENNFELTEATCSFDKIINADGWASDIITHVICCKKCGQTFRCHADTYHGIGGFDAENQVK
ncbi:MAG: hypothetical protein IJ002_07610 [Clostridia bacterium]|nr:hypothetical protein [Clostridia bacterium]